MWGSFNAGVVGYFHFVPVLLAEQDGMTITQSGALTSLARWVGMLSIPLGGTMAQWMRRPGATIVLFRGGAATALPRDHAEEVKRCPDNVDLMATRTCGMMGHGRAQVGFREIVAFK